MSLRKLFFLIGTTFILACTVQKDNAELPKSISGIYPHLAYYNNEGECGTGAVVPWANRLWVITYGPHLPFGSSDKLYEITPDLSQIPRNESIGGTHANRMIHRESKQLFIGPYAISEEGKVRVIAYKDAPGRYTGCARHLIDPTNRIYIATMEEGFYDINVHDLSIKTLFVDGNAVRKNGSMAQYSPLLPGVHGKGVYSGQGGLVYSNNGEDTQEALEKFNVESGSLNEWDGKNWKLIRRNQFVEVTGPGGIYGNTHPVTDPIWATGWDYKSVLLGVRDPHKGWSFYRLPKASHSYDGAHGWNTEWPRIRDVGIPENPDYLMTMHGMFWRFPKTFTMDNTAGIRPRSAYLKVIGDFTRWNDKLVFGCDDSAKNEFLNKRRQKGNIKGPGQSNSNLWFTSLEKPDQLGPTTASGAVWLHEETGRNEISEPFLFAGWSKRCAWIKNEGENVVDFVFEVDKTGNQIWNELRIVRMESGESQFIEFNNHEKGEWIRAKVNSPTTATVIFNYTGDEKRESTPSNIFTGLAQAEDTFSLGGLLYGLGNNRHTLGISAVKFENGIAKEVGYYELDENLKLTPIDDPETNEFIKANFTIPKNAIEIQESSVLIIDDKNRRWRLPLGNRAYEQLTETGQSRICREVVTERDLFNAAGTFYELPAENADGFAKIRPIASHNFRIHDYASYRGMLVMTGIDPNTKENEHIVHSKDGQAAVWVGVIDDLWDMGKPIGQGGPWKNSQVNAGIPSDPYLIGFYDKRSMEISHDAKEPITFIMEVNPIGHGSWMEYKKVIVKAGETYRYQFPENFQARWIRFVADKNCNATIWLNYL